MTGSPYLTPVQTSEAPKALGPYSQAIKAPPFLFVSGNIPADAESGEIVQGGIVEQTMQVLRNLNAVLEAAGSKPENVAKTTVFLKDMNDFSAMNNVYAEYFGEHKPARSTVEVSRLPKDVLVEIECIATYSEPIPH